MDILTFLGGMFGTRPIEITAALCGLINVVLIIRRSMWNYPFGFAMVALYAVIFYDYKLYSDAILQVFFFVIQGFGLVWWLWGRDATGALVVLRLGLRQSLLSFSAAGLGALVIGFLMQRYTDAALPFWDATVASLSVVAQTLLARRHMANWYYWIAVDIVAIGVFVAKGLVPTAALYTIFLGLAVSGLMQWRRVLRAQEG